jgi:hypothetical protein
MTTEEGNMRRVKRVTFGLNLVDPAHNESSKLLHKLLSTNKQNYLRLLLIIGSSAERANAKNRGDNEC